MDSWRYTRIDVRTPLTGIACPSASECVAVDAAGRVLTTTRPLGGPWQIAAVDHGLPLTAVACANVRMCVAVDGARHALTSTVPTAGRSA